MIHVEFLDPLPAGNPFHHDLFSCGYSLGSNVTAMVQSPNNAKEQDFVILCNHDTGERVALCFSEEGKRTAAKTLNLARIFHEMKKDEK